MTAEWRIVLRDEAENRIGRLRHFNSATFIPRRNGIGSWAIEIPYEAPGASDIVPGCGITVYRNGKYVISGPMRFYEESWNEDRKQPILNIAGVSDEYLLKTRVAFPNPNSNVVSQTVNATRRLTGQAETVAKTVVKENFLNTTAAVLERVMPNFSVAPDLGRGSAVAISLRFDVILTWLQAMCPPAGLGFRVVYSQEDKFVFDVYVPNDYSLDIVFSRGQRNITSYKYSLGAPDTTTVFVGGQGAGTTRAFSQVTNVPPFEWGFRDEMFLDRRDTNDSAELLQAANDALFESGTPTSGFSFAIKDTAQIQFGRDYDLGDKVGFRIREEQFADTVNSVQYDVQGGTERVTPVVGDFETANLKVYSVVAKLARRIGQVERRT